MTEPWDMHDPRRRHSSTPVVDEYSETVLRDAIHSLTLLRSPMWEGDAGAALHAIGSLLAQTLVLLPGVTQLARDQEYSWVEIADLLGLDPSELAVNGVHVPVSWRAPLDTD